MGVLVYGWGKLGEVLGTRRGIPAVEGWRTAPREAPQPPDGRGLRSLLTRHLAREDPAAILPDALISPSRQLGKDPLDGALPLWRPRDTVLAPELLLEVVARGIDPLPQLSQVCSLGTALVLEVLLHLTNRWKKPIFKLLALQVDYLKTYLKSQ